MPRAFLPPVSTAPVLAIVVCHNGEAWLPLALSALRRGAIRPRHVLAVDTGSTDSTTELLAAAAEPDDLTGPAVLDGVLTLPADTGFAAAVDEAVCQARERWGDPGRWIWLLHDDCAPEPDCLDLLLRTAESAPSAAMLGPLAVDWSDPQLIVEAGLTTDASGHRRHTATQRASAADPSGRSNAEVGPRPDLEQSTEVLAVPSAGALVERAVWEELGGFDPEIPLLREDIDFGWRVNATGRLVLCVPQARLRHVRAVRTVGRDAQVLSGSVAAVDRLWGLRTFLANCSPMSFVLGLPRLVLLCLLRGLGFAVLGNRRRVSAEFSAIGFLCSGRANLRSARAARISGNHRGHGHGLLTGRVSRLHQALRRGAMSLVYPRRGQEVALGRLPVTSGGSAIWISPEARYRRSVPVGPNALPAGALQTIGPNRAHSTGLRRPPGAAAVQLPEQRKPAEDTGDIEGTAAEPVQRRPSPGNHAGVDASEQMFLEEDRRWYHTLIRFTPAAIRFVPVAVLLIVLTTYALILNGTRLGLDLAGGSLLPVGDLGTVWSTYLEPWHAVAGGTAGAPPPALAVLGLLAAPLAPIGGPAALVALLLICDVPLAALSAYAAMRRLPVHRWIRTGIAAAYGLLPPAAVGAAQGRVDVVVVHLLLPAVLAGIVGVLIRSGPRWLSRSVLCALALAVIGAFSPPAYGLVLAALAIGFVVLPRPQSGLMRAATAVTTVVVLPLLLLLPWMPALFAHPGLLLHGFHGPAQAQPTAAELLGLDPGGTTGISIGIVVLVAALVAVITRPTVRAVPGFALLLLGIAGVAALQVIDVAPVRGGAPAPGFTGVALLFAGAGLLAVMLGTCVSGERALPLPLARIGAVSGVALLLVLAAGNVLAGRDGPVRAAGGVRLAPSLAAELADTGRSVLVLGDVVRQTAGRTPQSGDDALAPVPGATDRLANWQDGLLAGSQEAFSSAAAAGVLFIVLPPGTDGDLLQQSAPDLLAAAPPTRDGRDVVRLTPVAGQVTLVSPEQARRAVEGQPPDQELMGGAAVAPVEAHLPDARVRTSDGPDGRMLVLAAEYEPGWQASVDGEEVPIVRAWDHQVAVAVPAREADVVVTYSSARHSVLLLVQLAALLFAGLTAIPARRRNVAAPDQSPSMMSGSTPR